MRQPSETHKMMATRLGMGASPRIPSIWAMLCDEDEAQIMTMLPNNIEGLVEKTGKPAEEIRKALDGLFIKGVVFKRVKDGATKYNPPKNLVQFHDASVLWKDAPAEFIDLWKEFMDEEYPAFLDMINAAGMGPFMRIIPVNKQLESRQHVLPYEYAVKMIEEAKSLAVTDCTCRKTQRRCDAPLDVCLQTNKGAEYNIERGTGRAVTKEEAIEIIDRAEKAGLIHLTENKSEAGNVICNCCSCCCMAMEPYVHAGVKAFAAPSRFKAVVNKEACSGCMACAPRCHTKAIAQDGAVISIEDEKCIGCGLCASVCEYDALALEEARPPEFIPGK